MYIVYESPAPPTAVIITCGQEEGLGTNLMVPLGDLLTGIR
jgi:hypothetical protein